MAKRKPNIETTTSLFSSFGEQLPAYLFNTPNFVVADLLSGVRHFEVRRRIKHQGDIRAYFFVGGAYPRIEGYVTFDAPNERPIEEILPLFPEKRESIQRFLAGARSAYVLEARDPQTFDRTVSLDEALQACPSWGPPADYEYCSLQDANYVRLCALLRDRPTANQRRLNKGNPGCQA